jgi:hypothetical protein
LWGAAGERVAPCGRRSVQQVAPWVALQVSRLPLVGAGVCNRLPLGGVAGEQVAPCGRCRWALECATGCPLGGVAGEQVAPCRRWSVPQAVPCVRGEYQQHTHRMHACPHIHVTLQRCMAPPARGCSYFHRVPAAHRTPHAACRMHARISPPRCNVVFQWHPLADAPTFIEYQQQHTLYSSGSNPSPIRCQVHGD